MRVVKRVEIPMSIAHKLPVFGTVALWAILSAAAGLSLTNETHAQTAGVSAAADTKPFYYFLVPQGSSILISPAPGANVTPGEMLANGKIFLMPAEAVGPPKAKVLTATAKLTGTIKCLAIADSARVFDSLQTISGDRNTLVICNVAPLATKEFADSIKSYWAGRDLTVASLNQLSDAVLDFAHRQKLAITNVTFPAQDPGELSSGTVRLLVFRGP